MDVVLDLIGGMAWLASPIGIVAAVVVTAFMLSGIPGSLVLVISARMPR